MKLLHSIRWRVQLWHSLVLLVVIAGLCAATWQLVWVNHSRRLDRELHGRERQLIRGLMRGMGEQMTKAPDTGGPFPPLPEELLKRLEQGGVELDAGTRELFTGKEAGHYYFAFANATGRILLESGNLPLEPAFPSWIGDVPQEAFRTRGGLRERLHLNDFGLWSIVGRDMRPELEEMRTFGIGIGGLGLALWLLGIAGGWWLAGRSIRPIADISRTALRISDGSLDDRIPVREGAGELNELARVLNTTFDRLQQALERQRRFTADASHELRTPLTVILTETQRIARKERTPEEYRDALEQVGRAGRRMRALVEGLLVLARQDDGRSLLSPETCQVGDILLEVATGVRPLAEQHGHELVTRCESLQARLDPRALEDIVGNLLKNAISHHGAAGGRIELHCAARSGELVIQVRDDGQGIPQEVQERIFERFYRVDASRGGEGTHSGLGLAIVRSLAEAMGGSVTVESRPGEGSCFELRLPLDPGKDSA